MRPENTTFDRELAARALQVGFLASNCDACGASGLRGRRVDPRDPDGAAADESCAECCGSGRWWFAAVRRLGTFTAHLTDAQLRAQLWCEEGGSVGNQG